MLEGFLVGLPALEKAIRSCCVKSDQYMRCQLLVGIYDTACDLDFC